MTFSRIRLFCLLGILVAAITAARAVPVKDPFQRSIVALKVTYSSPTPLQPWQMSPPKSRAGQAVAVGPNRLLAIASIIQNHELIQVESAFQTDLVEAKPILVDYDVNLCLLEVDPEDLEKPFVPIPFKKKFRLGETVDLIWLAGNHRFIKTKGRVEYPSVSYFSRSGSGFLYFQISSDSSPEGYSEPVFQGKKLIGLIESFHSKKKSSSLLPAPVMIDFLERSREKSYTSVPKAGFSFYPLKDQSTRRYLKLPDDEKRGIYIKQVYDFGTGHEELEPEDVLLSLDGYDIDPQGNVTHPEYGNLVLWYLFGTYPTGSRIDIELWRNGEHLEKKMVLDTFSASDMPIPDFLYDVRPEYIVRGGFIFQELNFDYVTEFDNWKSSIDPLIYQYIHENLFKHFENRRRIVLLNHVLRHPINQGYQNLSNKILRSINGVRVRDIGHLAELFSHKPENGFHVLEFEGYTVNVVLPLDSLDHADEEIRENYGIPELSRIRS